MSAALIRILFIGVNPDDTPALALTRESKRIDEALRKTRYRDRFELVQQWEAEARELPELLMRFEPQILHFCGHGNTDGRLSFRGPDGQAVQADTETLAQLFGVLDGVRCVVLNACHSAEQAARIARHVDVVIGMSASIGDSAAIEFSAGFYGALGYGKSVEDAFELAKIGAGLSNSQGAAFSRLFVREGVDASTLVLSEVEEGEASTLHLRGEHEDEGATRVSASASEGLVLAPRGGVELVTLPGGRFMLGSRRGEAERSEDERLHEVDVRRFQIARTPVTNLHYAAYLRANPQTARTPEYWQRPGYDHAMQPVVGVSWHDAQAYCEWAGLRLPSEAEWEYACRAGTRTRYWSGNSEADLARVGWYGDNADNRLHRVAQAPANVYGLFDMHGNVDEWCSDRYGDYRSVSARGENSVLASRLGYVLRGGTWQNSARYARSAARGHAPADGCGDDLGFRPCCSV